MRLPHLRRPRLSYANVTATLALVIATSTGGAYAAATIGSNQIQNNAIKSRHIAKGNVETSDLHSGAVTGQKLGKGAVGQLRLAKGVAAARAYGTIWWPGTSVTNSRNLSLANVSHPGTGIYCISGLNFTPVLAVASSTNEWNAGRSDVSVWNADGAQTQGCPTGTQLEVRLYSIGSSTLVDSNFSIVVY